MINTLETNTNQELLKIIGFPKNLIQGDSLSQSIGFLLNHPKHASKAKALTELCSRYGEERLFRGAPFRTSSDVFNHFRIRLRDQKQEHFIVVFLDNKHQYLCDRVITKGILNKSLVHPREVYAPAVELRSAAVILCHNHPSGDPTASQEDIQITKRLAESGTLLGIPVLDHIVIGNDRYYSLADEGLL